jgi:hypothetical protein
LDQYVRLSSLTEAPADYDVAQDVFVTVAGGASFIVLSRACVSLERLTYCFFRLSRLCVTTTV